jgi:hypothetical protein
VTARPQRTSLWTLVAVLAFALRSLVPAGFMWAPLDGHVTVVACSDFSADVVALASHHHHHHHGVAQGGSSATGDSCPFALAGGAAFASSAPGLAVQHFEIVQARLPVFDTSAPRSIPLRFLAPRGPPAAA